MHAVSVELLQFQMGNYILHGSKANTFYLEICYHGDVTKYWLLRSVDKDQLIQKIANKQTNNKKDQKSNITIHGQRRKSVVWLIMGIRETP